MGNQPIRVVLADDHEIVRKGIRDLLEDEGDIVVLAEATTGAEAVALTVEHQPDVAVLDIQMPVMTGIEAARQIKAKRADVRILVLTAYDDDPYIFAMLQAGASGYVLKNAPSDELVRAVRTIAEGGSAMVEVTPLNLADGGASLDFDVAFNTHSVDLDFDPAAISILRDDQGREYLAIAWEGVGPGRHHRGGTLRF